MSVLFAAGLVWFVPVMVIFLLGALVYAAIGTWQAKGSYMAASLLSLALALGLFWVYVSRDADPHSPDPHPLSQPEIVALGDSYMSGEGARHFFPGTDREGRKQHNTCRRASTAYAWEIADVMQASLTFVACSGAKTKDVIGDKGQQPDSDPSVFGRLPQLEVLKGIENPEIVLLSIGGNDSGFGDIGQACAIPGRSCRTEIAKDLVRVGGPVREALKETFTQVREATEDSADEVATFVMTYPNPLGAYNEPKCGYLPLDKGEIALIRDTFLPALNQVIREEATYARLHVIDLEGALNGYRLCQRYVGAAAINFVNAGRTNGARDHAKITELFRGTFHPNETGHDLLGAVVRAQLDKWKAGELQPVPKPADLPPRQPLPTLPPVARSAVDPYLEAAKASCNWESIGKEGTAVYVPGSDTYRLEGVQPSSTVCYLRGRTADPTWRTATSDASGRVAIPVGDGMITEVLVPTETPGVWQHIALTPSGGNAAEEPNGQPEPAPGASPKKALSAFAPIEIFRNLAGVDEVIVVLGGVLCLLLIVMVIVWLARLGMFVVARF